MSDKKKKNTGLAVACWFLIFLGLLLFFIVKQDVIISNLKATHFFERVTGSTPSFIKEYPDKSVPDEEAAKNSNIPPVETKQPENKIAAENTLPVNDELQDTSVPDNKPIASDPVQKNISGTVLSNVENESKRSIENKSDQSEAPNKSTEFAKAAKTATFKTTICFVEIDGDGSISRKLIPETMAKSDSPLSDVLALLLTGPSYEEQSKGYMSLIPAGTRLLSASVRDGVAYLNFSEEFEFNKVGVEGYIAQLMQIVYTSTSFNTVTSVQFLIDGQKKEYLGSEGVWIGSPLSRESFK